MRQARTDIGASDVRELVTDTALHKAAACAVQARGQELGLVLPAEKAGKLVMHVQLKEQANAQLRAAGSLAVIGRIRRPAPLGAAPTAVLLQHAPPSSVAPASRTMLPMAARAAARSTMYAPVLVPSAPPLPLPAAPQAPAGAGGAAGEAASGDKNKLRREKYKNATLEQKERRRVKRRKPAGAAGYRGAYNT